MINLTDTELLDVRKYALQMARANSPMADADNIVIARAMTFETYLIRDSDTDAPANSGA